jgi:hypothetical protein
MRHPSIDAMEPVSICRFLRITGTRADLVMICGNSKSEAYTLDGRSGGY